MIDGTSADYWKLGDMNKRFALAAAYVAFWATVGGGMMYAITRAGYPMWVAGASAYLLFIFLNGSLAYRTRVRQLRREGKDRPPYFKFLFFPQGFPKYKEQAPRSTHFFVGIAAAITGLFFVFCGVALAFDAEWSRISHPIVGASVCAVLAGLGGSFLYLAWRLIAFSMRQTTHVA